MACAATPGDTRRDPAKGTELCSCCQGFQALPVHLGRDGLQEQLWLPGMQEEPSEVTLGLLTMLCFKCKSAFCIVTNERRQSIPRSCSERRGNPITSRAPPASTSRLRERLSRRMSCPISSHVRPKSILLCAEITSSRDFTN